MKCASVSRTLFNPLSLLRHIASSSWDSGRAKVHACGGDKKRSQFLQNDTDAGREINASQHGTIRFSHIVSEYPPLYRHCEKLFSSHFNTVVHTMLTYSLDTQHTNWPSWARWEFLISALALDSSLYHGLALTAIGAKDSSNCRARYKFHVHHGGICVISE